MIHALTILSFLAGSALAHLQLSDPYPIKSALNRPVSDIRGDTSYRNPLTADGLQYPCKGYLKETDPELMTSQKTWSAGTAQTFTLEGSVFHGGGSCQLSLSYDMGETWNVIHSIIGGCMNEGLTNGFTLPKEAPGGEAVFSWSWFNQMGDREMYQNCAIVTIINGGTGLNVKDHPAPFVANVGTSINDCSTAGGRDVVFPHPGKSVVYSGGFKGKVPQAGLNVVGTGCEHPGGADGAGTRPGKESVGGSSFVSSLSSSTATSQTSTTGVVGKIQPTSGGRYAKRGVAANGRARRDRGASAARSQGRPE